LITILQILAVLLDVVWWIIIVQAVLSWLIAFNVINTYNPTVRAIWQALQRMTDPLYRPIRRIMPDFGALDLSPMVVLIVIYILRYIVIPNVAAWYLGIGAI
jgi:YggT family protein